MGGQGHRFQPADSHNSGDCRSHRKVRNSGRGIVPESGNSGSRNRRPDTVDSGNSAVRNRRCHTLRCTGFRANSGNVRGGYRKADVRPDIPILVVDNRGDLERGKLMASYRNSQADRIIAAAGKSGIPVAQRANSAPVQATIPAAQPAGAPVEFLKPGTLFSGTASRIFEGVQTFVIVEIVQYSPVTHSLSLVMRNNGGWTDARPYRGTAFP